MSTELPISGYGAVTEKAMRITNPGHLRLTIALVGAHFRPPAKAVLSGLPTSTELILEPEPDNPYDGKAIKVLVDLSNVDQETLALTLADGGTGHEVDDLETVFHLGYLADSDGKATRGKPGNREVGQLIWKLTDGGQEPIDQRLSATLSFDSDGNPQVIVSERDGRSCAQGQSPDF